MDKLEAIERAIVENIEAYGTLNTVIRRDNGLYQIETFELDLKDMAKDIITALEKANG